MCNQFDNLRSLLWSDLCLVDINAYNNYLTAVEHGLRAVTIGDLDGSAEFIGRKCCCSNPDFGFELKACIGDNAENHPLVGGVADNNLVVGAKNNVNSGIGAGGLELCSCGLSTDSPGGCECRSTGGGVDASVQSSELREGNSKIDGGTVGVPLLSRGPNYLRNKLNRDKKKRNKKNASTVPVASAGGTKLASSSQGFWNSCSDAVRQQLIDSKAKMHIADNERREMESRAKCEEMNSSFFLAKKIVKMADFADKINDRPGVNKVYGWAKTIATDSVESLARSSTTSVSFDDINVDEISRSSYESEIEKKNSVILDLEKALAEKTSLCDIKDSRIHELQLANALDKSRSEMLTTASVRIGKKEVDASGGIIAHDFHTPDDLFASKPALLSTAAERMNFGMNMGDKKKKIKQSWAYVPYNQSHAYDE